MLSKNPKLFLTPVLFAIIFANILWFVSPALAQVSTPAPAWTGIVPCGRNTGTAAEMAPCTLCHLVVGFQRLVQYGMYMVVTLALVGIFFAGVMYMVSTGDENMMTQAKGFLKVSLIGFAVVISGWLIVNVTMWVLGAKTDLGVNAVAWNKFTCDTKSSQGTSGLATSSPASPGTSSPPVSPAPASGTIANPGPSTGNSGNTGTPGNTGTSNLPVTGESTAPVSTNNSGANTSGGDVDLTFPTSYGHMIGISGSGAGYNSIPFSQNVTITNNGNDSAGAFDVQLYLSGTDNPFNPQNHDTPQLLAAWHVDSLAGGQTATHKFENMVVSGESIHMPYYIVAKIDSGNNINETDKSNNVTAKSFGFYR